MKIIVNNESYLLEYLINNVDKSRKQLKAYLKYGNIKVNNKVVTKYDKFLKKDDVIEISESKDKTKNSVIIYEDKDIIVIDKPYGMLSIASEAEKDNTAYKLIMEYLKSINKNNKVFIVHRLDKDTSGVLLFAKNEKTKELLQSNWDSIVDRKYIGVVAGKVEKETGIIESLLNENDEHMVYSDDAGTKAITEYKRLKYNDKYSLLDIKIHTGRKNQIRVHMKDINHIIVGDKKYGSTINPLKRMCLHAYHLELINPINNEKQTFESKVPKSFMTLFKSISEENIDANKNPKTTNKLPR